MQKVQLKVPEYAKKSKHQKRSQYKKFLLFGIFIPFLVVCIANTELHSEDFLKSVFLCMNIKDIL